MRLHPSAIRDLHRAIITTRRHLQRNPWDTFNRDLLREAEARYLRLTGRDVDEAQP